MTTPDRLYAELGRQIVRLRQSKGWTQQGLVDRTGMTQSVISELEHGKRHMTIRTLWRLAAAFDTKAATILKMAEDAI